MVITTNGFHAVCSQAVLCRPTEALVAFLALLAEELHLVYVSIVRLLLACGGVGCNTCGGEWWQQAPSLLTEMVE